MLKAILFPALFQSCCAGHGDRGFRANVASAYDSTASQGKATLAVCRYCPNFVSTSHNNATGDTVASLFRHPSYDVMLSP